MTLTRLEPGSMMPSTNHQLTAQECSSSFHLGRMLRPSSEILLSMTHLSLNRPYLRSNYLGLGGSGLEHYTSKFTSSCHIGNQLRRAVL